MTLRGKQPGCQQKRLMARGREWRPPYYVALYCQIQDKKLVPWPIYFLSLIPLFDQVRLQNIWNLPFILPRACGAPTSAYPGACLR